MKKDNRIFLLHILESINEIENHIKRISESKFLEDVKTQDAIIRRIEIIGEAVKNISADFRRKHADIEWRAIAGMRDKLIHEYFGVNAKLVWVVVKRDIPKLKNQITKLI